MRRARSGLGRGSTLGFMVVWWCEGVLFLGQFMVRGRGGSGISDIQLAWSQGGLSLRS